MAKGKNSPTSTKSFLTNEDRVERVIGFIDAEFKQYEHLTSLDRVQRLEQSFHGIFNVEKDYKRLRQHMLGLLQEDDYDPNKEDVSMSRSMAGVLFGMLRDMPKGEAQLLFERLKKEGVVG